MIICTLKHSYISEINPHTNIYHCAKFQTCMTFCTIIYISTALIIIYIDRVHFDAPVLSAMLFKAWPSACCSSTFFLKMAAVTQYTRVDYVVF